MTNRKGYTLMELIVVAGIIAVMTSIFMGADLPRKKLALQREAYFLAQELRTIEISSSAIQGSDACRTLPASDTEPEEGYAPFGGYAILFEKDKTEYYVFSNCAPIKTRTSGRYEESARMNNGGDSCENFSISFIDGGFGSACVDEKIETVDMKSRSEGVKILKIEAKKNKENDFKDCEELIVGFEPPAPIPYIICKQNGVYNYGITTTTSPCDEARITISSDGAGSRSIVVNAAGMISTTMEQ